jgi:hypothetical protein
MPRIRCHYEDCIFLEAGFCTADKIELDPETGCLTYQRADEAEVVEEAWEEEEFVKEEAEPDEELFEDEDEEEEEVEWEEDDEDDDEDEDEW